MELSNNLQLEILNSNNNTNKYMEVTVILDIIKAKWEWMNCKK